ncbi:hypothetical protein ACFPOG_12455 [Paenibacillus aestuarii]|uniref:ABC transporter permease n=1 Tax=Paenibacillus aestuarii TaxID=516965 RepID=A0ABW0K7W1_9BACL
MSNQPFRQPSKIWIYVLIPFALMSVSFTAFFTYLLITMGSPTTTAKIYVIAGIFSSFAVFNLLIGYLFLRWVVPKKNELFQLLSQDKHLISFKYGRFFLDNEALREAKVDPGSFKRLQQRDLREVYELLHKNK